MFIMNEIPQLPTVHIFREDTQRVYGIGVVVLCNFRGKIVPCLKTYKSFIDMSIKQCYFGSLLWKNQGKERRIKMKIRKKILAAEGETACYALKIARKWGIFRQGNLKAIATYEETCRNRQVFVTTDTEEFVSALLFKVKQEEYAIYLDCPLKRDMAAGCPVYNKIGGIIGLIKRKVHGVLWSVHWNNESQVIANADRMICAANVQADCLHSQVPCSTTADGYQEVLQTARKPLTVNAHCSFENTNQKTQINISETFPPRRPMQPFPARPKLKIKDNHNAKEERKTDLKKDVKKSNGKPEVVDETAIYVYTEMKQTSDDDEIYDYCDVKKSNGKPEVVDETVVDNDMELKQASHADVIYDVPAPIVQESDDIYESFEELGDEKYSVPDEYYEEGNPSLNTSIGDEDETHSEKVSRRPPRRSSFKKPRFVDKRESGKCLKDLGQHHAGQTKAASANAANGRKKMTSKKRKNSRKRGNQIKLQCHGTICMYLDIRRQMDMIQKTVKELGGQQQNATVKEKNLIDDCYTPLYQNPVEKGQQKDTLAQPGEFKEAKPTPYNNDITCHCQTTVDKTRNVCDADLQEVGKKIGCTRSGSFGMKSKSFPNLADSDAQLNDYEAPENGHQGPMRKASSLSSLQSAKSSPNGSQLDPRLSIEDLTQNDVYEIALYLDKLDWERFGRQLGISEEKISEIKRSHCGGGHPAREFIALLKTSHPDEKMSDFRLKVLDIERKDVKVFIDKLPIKMQKGDLRNLSPDRSTELANLLESSEYKSIKCWKHLAEKYGLESRIHSIAASVKSNEQHSPTEVLFYYLRNAKPGLAISNMVSALEELNLNAASRFLKKLWAEKSSKIILDKQHLVDSGDGERYISCVDLKKMPFFPVKEGRLFDIRVEPDCVF